MTAQPRRLLSPAEYLARERAADYKSEYYAGVELPEVPPLRWQGAAIAAWLLPPAVR